MDILVWFQQTGKPPSKFSSFPCASLEAKSRRFKTCLALTQKEKETDYPDRTLPCSTTEIADEQTGLRHSLRLYWRAGCGTGVWSYEAALVQKLSILLSPCYLFTIDKTISTVRWAPFVLCLFSLCAVSGLVLAAR